MDPQMLFEDFAAPSQRAQALTRKCRFAIVPAQIRRSLFAFEDCRYGLFAQARSISRHIGPVSALGKADFRRACSVAVGLRPDKRQPFEAKMCFGFASPFSYCRIHSASSRAQYVTIKSAPARLREVIISRTAARSSKHPFSAPAFTMANSPLT